MMMRRAILHITGRRLKGGLIHGVSKAGMVSSTSGIHVVGIVATAVVSANLFDNSRKGVQGTLELGA
jgi:hypothetical protein